MIECSTRNEAASSEGVNAIEMRDVSFSYGKAGAVLEKVSLGIRGLDFVSIIGPNGGGKTTLLRLVLGLLQPDQGEVRIFGDEPRQARRRMGYMPQQPRVDPQFPMTVRDAVLMGRLGHARPFGPYGRINKERAAAALVQVGLFELSGRPISALSGGQLQRMLIARALACEPDLLLLDEPTSHLDLASRNDLYDLLNRLSERLTVVVVSHDVAFVSRFVRTVVCVNRTVEVHAAGDIAGDFISDMYGRDMRMIVHDHGSSRDHLHS